jgi:hypothetical protein
MEEKDRIISTERGLPKQPSFLTHITLLARLWALATLAGKVYDSSLILASFDYFVFKAHIFLLIEQKRERFLDSAAFYHFREYHLHDTSLSSEVSTGISCFEHMFVCF